MYLDVHAHLIHPTFEGQEDEVARRALHVGVSRIIVNGLEPKSNRAILELAKRHDNVLPALGIYPLDAVASHIDKATWPHPFSPPEPFDADLEVDFIRSQAKNIIAIGECGLDAYWDANHMAEQERILRRLIEVALDFDLPLILHTRKAEARTFEILQEMKVKKADFHCYTSRLKLARRIADAGYYFSIPPVVNRAEGFQRMVEKLPIECLLTETDSPYMGPFPNEANEPKNVPAAVKFMAELRGITSEAMAEQIRKNFEALFGVKAPIVRASET